MRSVLLLSLFVSGVTAAQPVPFPKLSAVQTKELEAGEVVVREVKPTDDRGIGAESMGVIDAPSHELAGHFPPISGVQLRPMFEANR